MDMMQHLSDRRSSSTKIRASSTLQGNAKFGPQQALDLEDLSTCWTSEGNQKTDAWLLLDFGRSVEAACLRVQFQAGFAAEQCRIESWSIDKPAWNSVDELELEDNHTLQERAFKSGGVCSTLRLTFSDCTDFYGRIIVYRLEIWGKER